MLFSKHFIRNENKHQIMNVHTKWNCLIPILSSLDQNYLFQFVENVSCIYVANKLAMIMTNVNDILDKDTVQIEK